MENKLVRHGMTEVCSEREFGSEIAKKRNVEGRIAALEILYIKTFHNALLRRVWVEWSTSSSGKKKLEEASLELNGCYVSHGLPGCNSFIEDVRKILKVKCSDVDDGQEERTDARVLVPTQAVRLIQEKKRYVTDVCKSVLGLSGEGLFELQKASLSANASLHENLSFEELDLVKKYAGIFGHWALEWLPNLALDLEALNFERD